MTETFSFARRLLFAGLAAATVLSTSPNTYAQDAAKVGVSAQLEEVTVTATRRADTNLQTTPISVSAVTAADIDRMVAKDISGLASSVPGFSASRITAFNAASFAMRGVGLTDIIVYQDSPVGVSVDDFVMPSVQTQLLDTFDIANAEVLRGPQGTLFGKNTTGGAVNLRTKRPNMTTLGGDLRLGFAKFGEKQVQGALDLPVVAGKFALRFVGSYIKSDGYYRLGATYGPIVSFNTNPNFNNPGPANPFPAPDFAPITIPGITGQSGSGTGARTGGQDVVSGRIKGQWNISDNVSALIQYEIMRDKSDAVPSYNDTPPTGPYLWNALGFTRPAGDPLEHVASTQRNDLLLKMGDGQKIDVDGAYLNVDWKIGNGYTLYSTTGYRKQSEHLPNTYTGAAPVNSVTGGAFSLFDATRDTERDTFQQEFRLASSLSGPFNYVAGAFYQRNDARFCVVQALGFVDLITNWAVGSLPQLFLNSTPQILCNKQKSTSVAGFVDGTYDVTDKFQIGAGFRYTRDQREWSGRTQVFFFALDPANPALSPADFSSPIEAGDFGRYPGGVIVDKNTPGFGNLKKSWSEPSWRVTGSYKFTDDVFSYLTISRGYKSGGYNDQTGTSGLLVPELTRPVNPEFATNYEIGLKTQFLDNRLRINPTIFYTKYSDAQRALNVITVKAGSQFQETVFYNAAKITAKGVELEVQALLTDNFRLRFAGSWLDAKYDEFVVNQPGITSADGSQINPINNLDLSGQPVPRSPKKSASLSGVYTWNLATAGKLELSGELYYEDRNLFYTSAAGRDFDAYLDSKTLANLSLGYTTDNGRYYARVYGKNLGDKRYRIATQSVATLWTHTQWGEPRNYGIQVGVKFGDSK
jgi:iron complex outermembrane recepter protein